MPGLSNRALLKSNGPKQNCGWSRTLQHTEGNYGDSFELWAKSNTLPNPNVQGSPGRNVEISYSKLIYLPVVIYEIQNPSSLLFESLRYVTDPTDQAKPRVPRSALFPITEQKQVKDSTPMRLARLSHLVFYHIIAELVLPTTENEWNLTATVTCFNVALDFSPASAVKQFLKTLYHGYYGVFFFWLRSSNHS